MTRWKWTDVDPRVDGLLESEGTVAAFLDGTSQHATTLVKLAGDEFQWAETSSCSRVVSTATPSRALGATFRPSQTNDVIGTYTVQVVAEEAAGGVELVCDAEDPPTTVRGRFFAGAPVGAVVVEGTLQYRVPAGHFVLLREVADVGQPTCMISVQVEQTLSL